MSAGIEAIAAEEFIYGALNGDSMLQGMVHGVFDGPAPLDTVSPWVSFQMLSGVDIWGIGIVRAATNMLWQVEIVAEAASFLSISQAARRVDYLLHGKQGVAKPDGTMLACVRTQPIVRPEVKGGIQFRHLGGIYRVWATGHSDVYEDEYEDSYDDTQEPEDE